MEEFGPVGTDVTWALYATLASISRKLEEGTRSGFWQLLKEDYRTNRRSLTRPGFQAMLMYRIGRWAAVHGRRRRPMLWLAEFLHIYIRNFCGVELYWTSQIGRRLHIAHQGGIVIHRFCKIGDDCIIRQGVTIGAADEWVPHTGPVLGSNVDIGAGAMILGNVNIGSHVRIGPNSVVTTDVPDNSTVFAPPSRVISWGDDGAEKEPTK